MIKGKLKPPNVREVKAALMERIQKAIPDNPKGLTVGIHESAGAHDESDDNETVAAIGAKNHFGFTNKEGISVPARPWLDVGVQSGQKKYERAVKQTVQQGGSLDDALELVGVFAQSSTQLYVRNLKEPPNAARTIKEKGSSNPLIDTGQMVQSITSVVVDSLPKEGADV